MHDHIIMCHLTKQIQSLDQSTDVAVRDYSHMVRPYFSSEHVTTFSISSLSETLVATRNRKR